MRIARWSLLLVLGLAPSVGGAQQTNFDTVQVHALQVAPGIHMLTGNGGNIGVVSGPDATFIIDDQYAPLTQKIVAAVAAISKDKIKFVVNTHWHGDHVGGNENLANAGALIFAHDNVRKRMSKDQFVQRLQQVQPASPKVALPIVTFSDTMSLHLNGEDIVIFHVKKAHTDGDALVYFRNANVIHCGDAFVRSYPFIDESSGGTFLGYIAGVQDLLAGTNASTKYIPGHGVLSTRKDVETFLQMLKTVRDRVDAQVKAKKTVDQAKAAKLLADFDPTWAKGFMTADMLVDVAYRELSAKK